MAETNTITGTYRTKRYGKWKPFTHPIPSDITDRDKVVEHLVAQIEKTHEDLKRPEEKSIKVHEIRFNLK